MTLLDGDPRTIGGYRLQGRLGAGGMGVVYSARSLSGRQVAVKVIRPELAQDPGFRSRFRREVAAARQVSGAFTAAVVDADAEAETPWLATLFIAGPSLAERVVRQGPLPVPEVRQLAAGLVEALRDIHRAGLVHRDLKPGNVLLADDGPRVIDFGIARASDATPLTRTGVAIGTPPFMAPEQFQRGTVSPATDIFSLGSVLVYAATGHGPFDGDHEHAIGFRVVYEDADLTGVQEELRPLVLACLEKDAGQRPSLDELLASLTETGTASPGPTPVRDRVAAPLTSPTPALDGSVAPAGAPAGAPRPPAEKPKQDQETPAPSAGSWETNSAPVGPLSPGDEPPNGVTGHPVPPQGPFAHPGRELPLFQGKLVGTTTAPQSRPAPLGTGRRRGILLGAAALVVAAAVTVPVLLYDRSKGQEDDRSKGAGPTASSSPSPSPSPALPLSCPTEESTLRGSGSSVQNAVMDRWISDYQSACPDDQLVYQGMGVGAGYREFTENLSDLAITDGVLTSEQIEESTRLKCRYGRAIHLPLTTMPIAVVVNLEGVDSPALSPETLAQIYTGEITKWNDPEIVKHNPGADLPDQRITAFHNSGSSSSTLFLSRYLDKAAPENWPYQPSPTMAVRGGQGAQSSQDIATQVAATEGAIGYVPMSYAEERDLLTVGLTNGNKPVTPTTESVAKGAGEAELRGTGPDLALDVNYTTAAEGAYPLIEFGYGVVCSRTNGPTVAPGLRAFLAQAVSEGGQQSAVELRHGRLPRHLTDQVRDVLRKLT